MLFLFVIFPEWVSAKVITVPDDMPTIQSAIESSMDGDTVLVRRGIYYENLNFIGKKILLTSNFIFDGLQETIDSTIIDASLPVDTLHRSCVLFQAGEDNNSILNGFTLQNGRGTYAPVYFGESDFTGAGIYCANSSPTIKNNVIKNNSTPAPFIYFKPGGGIAICCGSPILQNNTFVSNSATHGGAISCYPSCGALINNNLILDNQAGIAPSIFVYWSSAPTIINNTISDEADGIILSAYFSNPQLRNNTIVTAGKAIKCSNSSAQASFNNFWLSGVGYVADPQCGSGLGDTT